MIDLPFIWAVVISFAIFAYVVLDGFDLGVGILFPLGRNTHERDIMMNSIAPVWDGNETWLVLGGGGLFAAFPLAYAILLPALYAPLTAMLLGLIFRGVAFEFRFKTERAKPWWDRAFIGGSVLAAFCQGIALGAFVQGIRVEERAYAGGWFDWLSSFSVMTGLAVVVGYALLGAGWLILKTEGELQQRMYAIAPRLLAAVVFLILVVSVWTPLLDARIFLRWFSFPNIVFFWPVPVLVGLAAFGFLRAVRLRQDRWPFLLALALFALSFSGLGISAYPYIVPRTITVHQAAAPHDSLLFLLVGVALLVPLILAYTGYSYWVFRGKVDPHAGYH